jgi:hypothetical protein
MGTFQPASTPCSEATSLESTFNLYLVFPGCYFWICHYRSSWSGICSSNSYFTASYTSKTQSIYCNTNINAKHPSSLDSVPPGVSIITPPAQRSIPQFTLTLPTQRILYRLMPTLLFLRKCSCSYNSLPQIVVARTPSPTYFNLTTSDPESMVITIKCRTYSLHLVPRQAPSQRSLFRNGWLHCVWHWAYGFDFSSSDWQCSVPNLAPTVIKNPSGSSDLTITQDQGWPTSPPVFFCS